MLLLCGVAAAAVVLGPAAGLAPFASVNAGRPGGLVGLRGGSAFGQPSSMVRALHRSGFWAFLKLTSCVVGTHLWGEKEPSWFRP